MPSECQLLAHTVSKFINRRQKLSIEGQEYNGSIKLSIHVWGNLVGNAANKAFLNQIIGSNWPSFD